MKVRLAYGKTGLEVELPDHAVVLQPTRLPAVADPYTAIREALRRPLGSPPLAEKLRPHDTVAVVFSDITRPTPNHILIPAILVELADAGIPRENITLINGLGMHRLNTRQELVGLLGPEVVDNYRIVQHDAGDRSQLTHVLTSDRGVDVSVNSHYMGASARILTGFVEPHVFAGWSGGGKAVLPAVAGADIVMSNHSGPMVGHPNATWCVAEGNPIFAEMREVALATKPTFIVNVTINERKEITGVFAGDLVQAHDAGIAFAERAYVQPVPHPFDLAVTAHMGYPADINLYQAVKAMSVAARAVRPGGAVVLAAECAEGLGLHHYAELLQARDTPQELIELIEDPSFRAYDQWGVQVTAMTLAKVEGYLYSSVSAEDVRRAHMRPCPDIGKTVAALSQGYRASNGGKEPRILVLPYGHLTVPRVASG